MKGIVFDIQKFALNDGPGIRTVVFLKGCPLKCVWCCNPESQKHVPQLGYLAEKCSHCMKCVDSCPEGVFSSKSDKLEVDFMACNTNGTCVDTCTDNALKIYGHEADAGNIMQEVEKDIPYYRNSGGGVTLSGGEPMDQFEFSMELFRKARTKNIHTCMETSGYAPTEQFEKIREYTDLFLYDYKLTDDFLHKRYTGVSKKQIIKNLDYLHEKDSEIILRCILIPGINDTKDHFEAIVGLERRYANLAGIEIMPYHEFGKNKYESIGKVPYGIGTSTVKQEQVERWLEKFKSMGAQKIKKG